MTSNVATSNAATRLRPLTLAFTAPELERAFWADRQQRTLGASRLALMLGGSIYAAFGVLDGSVIPDVAQTAWIIRYGLVCPLTILLAALSFHPRMRRHVSWLSASMPLMAGLGIVAMIVLASPPGSYLYYAGLLIVCSSMYTFFHLRFTAALALAWGLVAAYEVSALLAGTAPAILLSNSFFLLGINVVGMIACYSTERILRAAYLDRQSVEILAQQDSLTGLLNRRAFFATAQAEVARCRRQGVPISALMLDIDHFKQINDSYGHAAGDRVLQIIAETLRGQLRAGDTACRYGGEEFLALLPDTSASQAFEIGERLRRAIIDADIGPGLMPHQVTASLGTAALAPDSAETLDELVRAADGALYGAKRGGRNVVVLAA